MKSKRFFALLLFLLLLGGSLYWYFFIYKPGQMPMDLTLISKNPIRIKKDDSIHFYSGGFAVSGEKTDFYSFEGVKVNNPIKQVSTPFTIKFSTENYALISDVFLYNTSRLPFQLVKEITGGTVLHMKEYYNLLLLLVKNESGESEPYAFNPKSEQFMALENPKQIEFLDCSADPKSGDFSVLTVEYSGSFPTARIFHYTNDLLPYGALSLEDELYYRIYRLPNHFILVGTHQILCYNMDGTEAWKIKAPALNHQAVFLDSGLLLYMNDVNLDPNGNNSLLIHLDGSFETISVQRGIRQIQPYRGGALGFEEDNVIVFMNKDGKLVKRTRINNTKIQNIYVSRLNYDYLYLRTTNDRLFVFSTRPRKDDSR